MSGIRVCVVPRNIDEKALKIYFSKPENGGGEIKNIYHPLFNGDAVIIFKDEHTAETVYVNMNGNEEAEFVVSRLPLIQAFPTLTATIDETVTVVLQSTQHIRDEIQHIGELTYCYDNDRNQSTLTGNWYQLEWAWAKIDKFMYQQKHLQKQISGMVDREGEQSTALPKGNKPVRGDDERPIISLPSTHGDDAEDRSNEGRVVVEVESDEDTAIDSARSIRVSNHGGKYETNDSSRMKSSLNAKTKSSSVAIATAALKDKEKHVTFTREKGDQSLISEQEDPEHSLVKKHNLKQSMTKKDGDIKPTMTTGHRDLMSSRTGARLQGDPSGQGDLKSSRAGTRLQGDSTGQGDLKSSRAGARLQGDPKATRILHDKPDDLRSLDFEHGNLKVHIYNGEITLVETDVIVNAAMGPLVNAGGVAKAIARAASPDMQRQCEDHVRRYGSLATSEVMHTCAGGSLNERVQHILHAVGPVWSESKQEACKFQLTRTFLNCFNYGNDKLKISSMTLPVISSGIFGCPLEVCVRSFVDAILLFTCQHEQEALQLKEVHLINNSGDNTAMTVTQVRQLIDDGLVRLTGEAVEFYRKMQDQESLQRYPMGQQYSEDRVPTGPRRDIPVGDSTSRHRDEPQGEKQSQPTTSGRPLPPVPKPDTDKKGKKK